MSSQNYIDATGIVIQDLSSIINDLINGNATVNGFAQIYGSDISVNSNTPDGQMINIFALSKKDILDLLVQDYAAKDPDQAVGVALDGISQLCGIARKGGTYTSVVVSITANQTVNLTGIDTANSTSSAFTISDLTGNQFQLLNSVTISSGTTNANFQAVQMGAIQVLANTVTVPVTILPGVTAVTNPSVPYIEGTDQETDAQLRLRRQNSTAVPGQGWLESLEGGLLTLNGVEEVHIYENTTNSTDAKSIPSHSIWVIVNGGDQQAVADMIYAYRNAGCGMTGNTTVNTTLPDGSTFSVAFDTAVSEGFYLRFSVTVLGGGSYDATALKAALVAGLTFGIYEPVDVTSVAAFVKTYNPQIVIYNTAVSTNNSTWYSNDVYPTAYKNYFTLNTTGITII